jgi:hypothetical protein
MSTDLEHLEFLNLLKRGTTMEICAERFVYCTTTEILDSDPDGAGGVMLTLQGTIEDGTLELTAPMIDAAEHNGDFWELRHDGIVFRFDIAQGLPAFGPDGFLHPQSRGTGRGSPRRCAARRSA